MTAQLPATSDVTALRAALYAAPLCATTFGAMVDACQEAGASAEDANGEALAALCGTTLSGLERQLAKANGTRRNRKLDMTDVLAVIKRARVGEYGMCSLGGGTVGKSYGYRASQTACVAVRRTNGTIRIGFAEVSATEGSSLTTRVCGLTKNAKPEQFRAWADAA